jgi:hypothetical protein
MSTNDQTNQPVIPVPAPQAPEPASPTSASNDTGQALVDLADALGSVNPKAPDAEVNATSIGDNNGGRIELNQDKIEHRASTPIIKK